MIVLIYTWANEVAGDRAPQWAARGTNVLFWMWDIFLRYKYEKVVYVYMLIRYCTHNILVNMGKKLGMLHLPLLGVLNPFYRHFHQRFFINQNIVSTTRI